MYTQLQMRGSARPPVSLATLHKMRETGDKIACLTCYDASFAVLVDEADADVVLVGDSLGMVIQGHRRPRSRHDGRHRLSLQGRGPRPAAPAF